MKNTVKNESDYVMALAEIERLIDLDPEAGSDEANRLDVLTILVQAYESRQFPARFPNAIDAIRFRMEQQNLKQRDLIQYIGSPSKVSEVLSGKRSLTLPMIRALHTNLGIPASLLLAEPDQNELDELGIEWARFPIREMVSRGWLEEPESQGRSIKEAILGFFEPVGLPTSVSALFKHSIAVDATLKTGSSQIPVSKYYRSTRKMDKYALAAWTARVMIVAVENRPPTKYVEGSVDKSFMQEVVKLSWSDNGPLLAVEFLRKYGIPLIVEPHLPQTHLDGAAILAWKERPIIGLTIRYDRVDNFWFSLMHELAHVALHRGQGFTHFYDDLDVKRSDDPREQEADELAKEVLVPQEAWENSPANSWKSAVAAKHLANELRIHPAIVAGKMRYEFNSYQILNNLVGHGEVRQLFKDVRWER